MKFKKGDVVRIKNGYDMPEIVGALAIVVKQDIKRPSYGGETACHIRFLDPQWTRAFGAVAGWYESAMEFATDPSDNNIEDAIEGEDVEQKDW